MWLNVSNQFKKNSDTLQEGSFCAKLTKRNEIAKDNII